MTNFINSMDDFLTHEEKVELNRQFIEDNFYLFDEDPFSYEYEGINLFDEHMY